MEQSRLAQHSTAQQGASVEYLLVCLFCMREARRDGMCTIGAGETAIDIGMKMMDEMLLGSVRQLPKESTVEAKGRI